MGLEYLHAVRPQILVDWISGILEIGKLARTRWTVLATGGGESLGNAVVAERTLFGSLLCRMNESAAVGTGLNTVAAAETVRGIYEDDAFGRIERGTDRADLRAR